MRTRLLAIAAAFTLIVAGCGGGDSEKATTTTAAPTTTTTADPAVDKDRAQKIVLTQSDVPGGFLQTEDAKEGSSDAEEHQLALCIGLKDDAATRTVKWSGASFTKEDHEIASEAEFKKVPADARADLDAMKTEKARNCLRNYAEKAFKAELDANAALTTTVVLQEKLTSADTAFNRVKSTVEVSGVSIDAYIDFISTVVDRALVNTMYLYIDEEPPLDVESSNLDKLRQRARDLQGIK